MDKITKALRKLTPKERAAFTKLLQLIASGKLDNLDVKQLSGHSDIFRVRKGKYRIIFQKQIDGSISVLAFERRNDRTYSKY